MNLRNISRKVIWNYSGGSHAIEMQCSFLAIKFGVSKRRMKVAFKKQAVVYSEFVKKVDRNSVGGSLSKISNAFATAYEQR